MASAFFTAFNNNSQWQLYKLGNDQSVTLWTAINAGTFGFDPFDLTEFNGNVWFDGLNATEGRQLYKLGFDGSVTQWTAINPAPFGGLFPRDLTVFNGNAWFSGDTGTQGRQLYKLGFDGSVTKWTAINPAGGGLFPQDMFEFANALWFSGTTGAGERQLFKLGADGSVTQWTAFAGGFDQWRLVSATTRIGPDPDSTPSSIFENAAFLAGSSAAFGTELYKLGADGSVTLWKDINPGPPSSLPQDWARFAV
jgi:hypothetical protein